MCFIKSLILFLISGLGLLEIFKKKKKKKKTNNKNKETNLREKISESWPQIACLIPNKAEICVNIFLLVWKMENINWSIINFFDKTPRARIFVLVRLRIPRQWKKFPPAEKFERTLCLYGDVHYFRSFHTQGSRPLGTGLTDLSFK